jgi:hypothetical protein
MHPPSPAPSDELAIARGAARRYSESVGLPDDQARELLEPPLSGPVDIDRDGNAVSAYRWLGGGRGAPYLQVEVDRAHGVVTVFGGANHVARDPVVYRIGELAAE